MFNRIHKLINRKSSKKTLWIFLALTLVNGVLFQIVPGEALMKAGTLDIAGFYAPSDVYEILMAQGAAGRSRYVLVESTVDLTFPFIFSAFFAFWITETWRKLLPEGSPWLKMNMLGLGSMGFDYLENVSAIILAVNFPTEFAGLAAAVSVFSAVK